METTLIIYGIVIIVMLTASIIINEKNKRQQKRREEEIQILIFKLSNEISDEDVKALNAASSEVLKAIRNVFNQWSKVFTIKED